jgi:hypothetical protein
MLHAVRVRAIKLELHSEPLRCSVLRGIGYSWACSCGERGPIMKSHRLARLAGREHSAAASPGTAPV